MPLPIVVEVTMVGEVTGCASLLQLPLLPLLPHCVVGHWSPMLVSVTLHCFFVICTIVYGVEITCERKTQIDFGKHIKYTRSKT